MNDISHTDILLVEDTQTDAEMTMRSLRKHGFGNRLAWVRDGSEALDFLFRRNAFAQREKRLPKLILLDLKMPKLNGIEVLRSMMDHEFLRAIPVVMLTSSAEERDIVDSYRLGVNSYIVKPVNMEYFDKVISEAGLYWLSINKAPV